MMHDAIFVSFVKKLKESSDLLDSRCLMHLLLVKTCWNDEQKPPLKVVILGLDPGIQGVFNLNAKDSYFLTAKQIYYEGPRIYIHPLPIPPPSKGGRWKDKPSPLGGEGWVRGISMLMLFGDR